MNRTIEELCAEAYHLQTNISFQLIQFSFLVLSISGIILILYVSINIFIKKIFHINLRILLANLLALLLLRSFVTIFRSSTFIYRMMAYEDQCSFLEESVKCSILSYFGSAPLKCLRYAFIAITIERFIAMCCYQRYEKWNYPIALAFLPLTVQFPKVHIEIYRKRSLFNSLNRINLTWIELALSIHHIVLTFYRSQNIYKSCCSSITSNAIPYLKLTLEIPLLIGLFFLLLITRIISKRKMILRLQTSMGTLSSRYQIRENMKTSKTMFIATIMYIMSAFLNLSGLLLLANLPEADLMHFAIFKEITSFAIAIFINCLPILFIIRVDYFHNKVIKRLSHFGCITTNRVGEGSMNRPLSDRQHIEIIQQIWEKGDSSVVLPVLLPCDWKTKKKEYSEGKWKPAFKT